MEITQDNIIDTINKMVIAGKTMPQKDRIRSAKNPEEEQQKVLIQTAQLWWELFSKRHIGVERWQQATDRALILNGIPRLDVSLVSPTLMEAALQQIEKEHLLEMETKHEAEKNMAAETEDGFKAAHFPELGVIMAHHLKIHRRPYFEFPGDEGLPAPETVMAWALKKGMEEQKVIKNMLQLRVYYLFGLYAKRDNTKIGLKCDFGNDGYLHMGVVD